MRHTFYKMTLKFANDSELPITLATTDIQNIKPLVEKHKLLYITTQKSELVGHPITDTMYTFNMSEEEYQNELMFCDIVDDEVKMAGVGDLIGSRF